jgi:DNA-binding SARP family transcriptional activator/ABC-type branched-subunit amino acid transport system substrate-binding protein
MKLSPFARVDGAILGEAASRAFSGRCQPPDRTPWYVRDLASALDFRILGPFDVLDGGRQLRLGGAKQRSVLAILVLHARETVSSDRLVEELWGDDPPADALTALQQHVSRLRKALEPHTVLVTRAPGYSLEIDPAQLDLERFRALQDGGRDALAEGRPDDAAARLREALSIWRGQPLADLGDEPFARDVVPALEDERLAAVESRIDADLAAGRHTELIGELATLVRAHPFRERLRAQQMLALYRSGRQSEALGAYASARDTLVSELGLEPGPELQQLQRDVLAHDESLTAPRPPAARRRRRVLALVATALASIAATAVVAAVALGNRSEAPLVTAGGGALLEIDPESGAIERRIPAGRTPAAVAVEPEAAVWLVDADGRTLMRVVPTSRVVETFATGATPTDVTVGARGVWVANGRRLPNAQFVGPVATAVARLDPATGTERSSASLPRGGGAVSNLVDNHVTASGAAVWAIGPNFHVARVDAVTGAVTATSSDVPAAAIAGGPAGVWVAGVDGAVARLDERTAKTVRRTSIPGFPGGIAVGDDAAWVTSPTDGRLWRIGAGRALSLGATQLARGIGDLAVTATGVWVANPIAGTLTHVDPKTTRIVRTIELDGIPRSVAVDGDVVWVALARGATVAPTQEVLGVTTFGTTTCERPLVGPDGAADVLITSDLPLQGGTRVSAAQMTQAIQFVLRERGFRAGEHRVAYQSCDDSVASTALFDEGKCAANARAYARNPTVVGVIGTMNSPCAVAAVPELNRAEGGPLAMVSPLNSFVGLTRSGPGVDPALPGALYPTGTRNYLRVYPTDDLEGAALALFAQGAGVDRVFVLDDGDPNYGGLQATAFETAASRLGLDVAGRASWDPLAASYETIARRVASSGAQAVYLGGLVDTNAGLVIRDLRSQLRGTVTLLGPSGLSPVPQLVRKSEKTAIGMYLGFSGILIDGLPPAGARFAERFGATQQGVQVGPEAIYAAQATDVLLDAIARSDGTRASVLRELFRTRMRRGLLGDFGFDANGDISESPVTILRVQRPGTSNTIMSAEGAAIAKVARPSPRLVAPDD